MQKSARILGQDYGLTAQEMNLVLKEEGFLDGEPGKYFLTEKGQQYANEQFHKRGTGGYPRYNPSWETRTWDDEITAQVDISDERKRQIREAVAAARRQSRAEPVDTPVSGDSPAPAGDGDSSAVLIAAVGALLAAVAAYGLYKAAPHVMDFWNGKAAPGLKKAKRKLIGKGEDAAPGHSGDEDSTSE